MFHLFDVPYSVWPLLLCWALQPSLCNASQLANSQLLMPGGLLHASYGSPQGTKEFVLHICKSIFSQECLGSKANALIKKKYECFFNLKLETQLTQRIIGGHASLAPFCTTMDHTK